MRPAYVEILEVESEAARPSSRAHWSPGSRRGLWRILPREYRLERGGNRPANAALCRAVIVRRMRRHAPIIAYVTRRTAERRSKREIMRCLQRYLAREIYQLLPVPPSNPRPPPHVNKTGDNLRARVVTERRRGL